MHRDTILEIPNYQPKYLKIVMNFVIVENQIWPQLYKVQF